MKTSTAQFIASIAFALPVSIIFALAAHGAEINPTVQPDCSKVQCTQDGVGQPEQEPIIILPPPFVGQESE